MSVPVIDVLISRDGSGWRLYFALHSWKPAHLPIPSEHLRDGIVAENAIASAHRSFGESVSSPVPGGGE